MLLHWETSQNFVNACVSHFSDVVNDFSDIVNNFSDIATVV